MSGISVLFVCLGNICRSPTAEGVFRARLLRSPLAGGVAVDSAGTGAWHVGKPPDYRAQAAALRRGYDISGLRARQISSADFQQFDYLFAMDQENLRVLLAMAPVQSRARVALMLDAIPASTVRDVPDPYYGDSNGFEHVLDLLESASDALLLRLQEAHR
jgi:protein-tyrosine phosphatase